MSRQRELRNFGLTVGTALALVFGLALPVLWKFPLSKWPWIVGGVFVLLGLAAPRLLKPIHGVWMRIAEFIGAVNSRILLTVSFYLIILPFGILMRIFRADPMARRFSKQAKSYRMISKQPSRMDRPF